MKKSPLGYSKYFDVFFFLAFIGTVVWLASSGVIASWLAIFLLFFIVLAFAGNIIEKRAFRIRNYYEMLTEKNNVCVIEDIASATGRTANAIRKDVRKAVKKGLMPNVRMDEKETRLILGEEEYQLYLQTKLARAEAAKLAESETHRLKDPVAAALENFKTEGKQTIARIRAANDALPGVDVSAKLDMLEITTAKIFNYVQAHPQKLPETHRFMNYYLPTVLKIIEKYKQYEEHEVQIVSIVKVKSEIEGTLDTINVAFVNMLNNLYEDDTLDVRTDIEVLHTMLEQEGLMGRKFEIEADSEELSL